MAELENEKTPRKLDVSRQLDQEKIDYLTKRREMEMKDDIIARLNEELVKRETQLKFEVEKMKKKFEGDLSELRAGTDNIIADLTSRLVSAENELLAVETYKIEKDQHDERVRQLEKGLLDQRQQMFDALEEQERKFLEEKAHIFKDLDDRKVAFREVALKEAKQAMSAEAKKILADNNRMFEELKFHHTMTAELELEKATLQNQLAVAKREVQILTDKEIEYAKQMFHKTKEIKTLRERVASLEKHQILNVEKFKQRTKEIKSAVSQELEDATLDAAGLRRLMHVKNQELRQMKSLAATIISQRSDVEQFFLEALREVREAIKIERKKAEIASKFTQSNADMNNVVIATTKSMRKSASGPVRLPSLSQPSLSRKGPLAAVAVAGDSHGRLNPSKFPVNPNEKVFIKDLSWEDKELVLRVLFAKMNGMQTSVDSVMRGTGAGGARFGNSADGSGIDMNGSMPAPVFLSEGAGDFFPDSMIEEATRFQSNFEVHQQVQQRPPLPGGNALWSQAQAPTYGGNVVESGRSTNASSRGPFNEGEGDDDDEGVSYSSRGKFVGMIGGESYHVQVEGSSDVPLSFNDESMN